MNCYTEHHYGFRKSKCTQDPIICLHDHIRQEMNRKNVRGALYIGLRKAFDTVSHSCLLSKLPYCGICGIELKWISDYLFNRTQYAAYNNDCSNLESVTLGVAQGSILGPLLFIILANDAYQCLNKCTMLMYADDTVLLYSASSSKLIEQTLNRKCNILFDWFNNNNLILKPGKTELVIYSTARNLATQPECNVELKGSKVNHATRYEYLGVSLDQHLAMSQQMTKIYKRINQRLKQLRRVRKNLTRSAAETIYVCMIELISLYCAPIYAGIYFHVKKLKKLEDKAKNTVSLTNHDNIEVKIKTRTATEVF